MRWQNLPISIFGGVGIACLIYLLCNVSYLLVLDADAVVAAPAVAAEHVSVAIAALLPARFAPLMSGAVAVLVALSAVGGEKPRLLCAASFASETCHATHNHVKTCTNGIASLLAGIINANAKC